MPAESPSNSLMDKTDKGGQCYFNIKQNAYHYQSENFECNLTFIKLNI